MPNKDLRMKRLYWVWSSMIQRCHNPKNKAYKNYGDRGIKVCKEWRTFERFYADMGLPDKGMTIERIDNDLGYSPDNCVWADRYAQSQNRRYARNITVDGTTCCIKEHWRRISPEGLTYRRVVKRIDDYGWPPEEALKRPPRGCKK